VPHPSPSENIYEYLERLKTAMNTPYVYAVIGNEVVSPLRGSVEPDIANLVVRTGLSTIRSLDFADEVELEPAGLEGKLYIKKVGKGHVIVFKPLRKGNGLVFEEVIMEE